MLDEYDILDMAYPDPENCNDPELLEAAWAFANAGYPVPLGYLTEMDCRGWETAEFD